MRQQRQRWLGFGLAALVLILDQLTKAWALAALPPGVLRPLLPGLLGLQLVFNRGAAFSLLTQATPLLAVVSAVVAAAVTVLLWRQRQLTPLQIGAAGMLLGGALGNGLDRWRLGAVIDFLALLPISFPVFNLADVAINLAVLAYGLSVLRTERPHEP